jgi:hypothetical protein
VGEAADDVQYSTPNHEQSEAAVIGRAADSVGEMARRVPALLAQVQQLLDNGGGGGEGEGRALGGKQHHTEGMQLGHEVAVEEDGEGRGRRLSRRAAVDECIEELYGQMTSATAQRALPLPPPDFLSRR